MKKILTSRNPLKLDLYFTDFKCVRNIKTDSGSSSSDLKGIDKAIFN